MPSKKGENRYQAPENVEEKIDQEFTNSCQWFIAVMAKKHEFHENAENKCQYYHEDKSR